jgi:hypothetical protein
MNSAHTAERLVLVHTSDERGVIEGLAASAAYLEAINPETSAERKEEIREELLKYGKHDTEAMVSLVGISQRTCGNFPYPLASQFPIPDAAPNIQYSQSCYYDGFGAKTGWISNGMQRRQVRT